MARSTTTIWLANRLGHADHRFTQPGASLWCWLGLMYMCRCIVRDVDDIAELVSEILYLPFWQRWWKDGGRNWHVWPHCTRALRRTSWVEPRQQFQWPSRFQWPNQALKWWLWKGNYSKIARIEVDGWDNWDNYFSWLQPRFDLTLSPVFAYHLGFQGFNSTLSTQFKQKGWQAGPRLIWFRRVKLRGHPPKSAYIIIIFSINMAAHGIFRHTQFLCWLHTHIHIYII